jgi:hypothetical protein
MRKAGSLAAVLALMLVVALAGCRRAERVEEAEAEAGAPQADSTATPAPATTR